MADEITPNKETPIIEPSNEPIQAPEAIPEPVTAQIPVNEPLATEPEPIATPEVKAEPVTENPPEELPLSPEVKSEPVIQPETITTPIVIASSINPIRSLLEKARNAIQSRKRKKLDRILNMFTNKSKITNDEVEKFLHVSDATATRYLEILEKEGKIKQNGKTGKGVSYSKM